ncbi:MAG: hypothetical protein P8M32_00075 [Phycisphaerales bacterium]|jgi:hypothetical protein|nr:hypothetical protein [Phycisphaerales bacterium]
MKNTILRLLERYVEFLVLGIVVVVFALYLSMQFVGDPNAGKDRKAGGTVSPADVNDVLDRRARDLKRELEKTGSAGMQGLTAPEASDLLDRYLHLAQSSTVPPRFEAFAVGPRGPVDKEGGDAATTELAKVNVPSIPAPEQAFVYQSFDTLADTVVAEYDTLADQFDETPFDVSWLTVAAEFDLDEVLARFRSKGEDGARALSERWYNGQVDVLDVVVERREVLADGTSSEPELINLLPGQLSFRERIEGEVSAGDRDNILNDLRGKLSQQMVVRPEFLPTMAGRWEDPEETSAKLSRGGEEDPRERLIRLVEKRKKLEDELERAGGGTGGGPGGGGGGGIGGGGGMGGGGGGMGAPPGGGGGMGAPPGGGGGMGAPPGGGGGMGSPPGDDPQRLIKRLQQRIRRLTTDINRLARQLGWSEEDIESYEPEEAADDEAFSLKGTLWIWAHDIDVEPGKTYEYRVSAVVYNPLFAKSLSLPESQREIASDVSLASLPGEWSDPYRVRQPTRAYVLRATAPGQGRSIAGPLGLGVAQVEIYRFYNGQWHSSRQSIQPGDEVGVVKERPSGEGPMDFTTGWYVVDIVADPLATPQNADSGRGAVVLFGQEGVQGVVEVRYPLVDRATVKPWIDEASDSDESEG